MIHPISVKETIERINQKWFLPAIQRPYVWGSRYDSEKYICNLFDSLFRGYPIGELIIWTTKSKVPFRKFINNYNRENIYENEEEGREEMEKSLVYDGQQRLQTIFSCVTSTFNDRVLVFDLGYDRNKDVAHRTGFYFIDKNEQVNGLEIKINYIFSTVNDVNNKKQEIRNEYKQKKCGDNAELGSVVEINLDKLCDVFTNKNYTQSMSYYEVNSESSCEVNEIFERLNTGGMPLSNADLLLSKIKSKYSNFESELMKYSQEINQKTGLYFDCYDILQVLHLIIKFRSRVDDNVSAADIVNFNSVWGKIKQPLNDFFYNYLEGQFCVSSMSIIPRKMPLLCIIIFFYRFYEDKGSWKCLTADQLRVINKFFITSEINDWSLQTYTDNFARIIIENKDSKDFPYGEIENYVKDKGNRNTQISERLFAYSYPWFSLKILTKSRHYNFSKNIKRFNPEIDHIFPLNLDSEKENPKYRPTVDIIWNFQPICGIDNNYKTNINPYDFFTDNHINGNGNRIQGSKYLQFYDFLPDLEKDVDTWHSYESFISYRKEKMLEFLKSKYDIVLVPDNELLS